MTITQKIAHARLSHCSRLCVSEYPGCDVYSTRWAAYQHSALCWSLAVISAYTLILQQSSVSLVGRTCLHVQMVEGFWRERFIPQFFEPFGHARDASGPWSPWYLQDHVTVIAWLPEASASHVSSRPILGSDLASALLAYTQSPRHEAFARS